MKKTILAVVVFLAITGAILAYFLIPLNDGQQAASAPPVPELTEEEKAAAKTKCPKEIALACLHAEEGLPEAQKKLAVAYSTGKGIEKNLLLSKMWWNIIAIGGDTTARAKRDVLRGKMSIADIAEADRLAWEWLAAHPTQPRPAEH